VKLCKDFFYCLKELPAHCRFIEAFELHGHDDRMMIICTIWYSFQDIYIYIYIGVVWIESKLSMLLVIQSMVVEERSNASYITSNLHAFV
jgi:hypothetical protein